MFERTDKSGTPVFIFFEERRIEARQGDSVAAALLAAGVAGFRVSAFDSAPRAPLCMIGNCYECLVEIDGVPNRQSCLTEVRDGMQIRAQIELRAVRDDD